MPRIDLNCDLGEGAGHDAELMPLITSANIACGAHAGDEATMRATVGLALRHGVAIGAHPGFADRGNFGRRELPLSPRESGNLVLEQTRRLQALAQEAGARVTHVKPHGALYNLSARDAAVARAIAAAVHECDPRLMLFGLAGSWSLTAARERGLRAAGEVFADRAYEPDGSLTPRSRADALIADEAACVAQVLRLVCEGRVRSVSGADVAIAADTVCLHGDGAHAVAFARRLRTALADAGVEVKAVARESRE
ncbi:MAG: LamB/YcsF family protein [Opitutus sp.]|nr:LamB/YcsF family protein [Opitutus sp.]